MSTRFRIRPTIAALSAALAVVFLPSLTAAAPSTVPRAGAEGVVTVTGAVDAPQRLDEAALAALPSRTVPVVYRNSRGAEAHIFRGPTLHAVLRQAKPSVRAGAKNDQLRFVVLATGSDGYAAALSLAEFDPDFGDTTALVARYMDGRKLAEPRLVVPGDGKGGRYVSELRSLAVTRLG